MPYFTYSNKIECSPFFSTELINPITFCQVPVIGFFNQTLKNKMFVLYLRFPAQIEN